MELASIFAQTMISSLVNLHALACMHRGSENDEYRQAAARWLPEIERQLECLKHELTKPAETPHAD